MGLKIEALNLDLADIQRDTQQARHGGSGWPTESHSLAADYGNERRRHLVKSGRSFLRIEESLDGRNRGERR